MNSEYPPNKRLQGKVAIVTGGASGIGEGICIELASYGAAIVIADLDQLRAEAVAKRICELGGEAVALTVDVRKQQSVTEAVAWTLGRFSTVDILVNCAGWNTFKPVHEVNAEEWEKIRSINLDGPWFFCQAVAPEMRKKGSGKIINIGSAAGILAIPQAAPYSIAKHALVALTRCFAVELGPYNVNVNCICPTSVDTPLLRKSTTAAFREKMVQNIPLGRLGKVCDIAKACLFLASSDSDFISGIVLPVDGGLTCCLRARHYEED